MGTPLPSHEPETRGSLRPLASAQPLRKDLVQSGAAHLGMEGWTEVPTDGTWLWPGTESPPLRTAHPAPHPLPQLSFGGPDRPRLWVDCAREGAHLLPQPWGCSLGHQLCGQWQGRRMLSSFEALAATVPSEQTPGEERESRASPGPQHKGGHCSWTPEGTPCYLFQEKHGSHQEPGYFLPFVLFLGAVRCPLTAQYQFEGHPTPTHHSGLPVA